MFFATLVLEREPTRWSDLPAGMKTWVQDVGALAAVVLVPCLLVYLVRQAQGRTRPAATGETRLAPPLLLGLTLVGSALGYLLALTGWLLGGDDRTLLDWGKTMGGACALLTVALPFLVALTRLSPRRIWALAKVSFKEAVRRRILWVFAFMLVFFLFASWFLTSKPENQVRDYVSAISLALAILLLIPAALLGAFGIPADMTNQTIYTIVTKPVERFEIYLGRVLGYIMLMSLVLFGMTAVSLLYVIRGVSPEAQYESLKARVPLYGELTLEPRGENLSVGREWEYRKYIQGGEMTHRAIWSYQRLPADLATRTEKIPCEYAFDIFRTTKGDEKRGVFCTFEFRSGALREADLPRFQQKREELLKKPGATSQDVDDQLAEEYGYWVLPYKEITDYHTDVIPIPVGVFKHALANEPLPDPENTSQPGPRLRVIVRCMSRTQYVGVAKPDLYLLGAERSAYLNFFKGAAGLWMLLCLVIGVAAACSTQLSGIIAFLATVFLFVAGMFQDYVVALARGAVEGGGPSQAMLRLFRGVPSPTIPLEASPGKSLAEGVDVLFQTLFGFLRMIVPDVNAYDLSDYVAEGFDVALLNFGGDDLIVKAILLVAYLLPWAIGAFYLLRWREVAA